MQACSIFAIYEKHDSSLHLFLVFCCHCLIIRTSGGNTMYSRLHRVDEYIIADRFRLAHHAFV